DLQPAMRRGVLNLFSYALEPRGILIVDPGDNVDATELFTRDPAQPELLRLNSGPRRVLELPAALRSFPRLGGEHGGHPLLPENFDTPSIFRHAMERYTPPSVLVDTNNRVLHFSATASRYVRIPGGELTLDILQLVPKSMRHTLGTGL